MAQSGVILPTHPASSRLFLGLCQAVTSCWHRGGYGLHPPAAAHLALLALLSSWPWATVVPWLIRLETSGRFPGALPVPCMASLAIVHACCPGPRTPSSAAQRPGAAEHHAVPCQQAGFLGDCSSLANSSRYVLIGGQAGWTGGQARLRPLLLEPWSEQTPADLQGASPRILSAAL